MDILGHVEYGHLVDFFRVYNRDYGDLATRYEEEEEKQQANDSSFPTMREWMPEDALGLDESRIRLLRHGPDVQFKSFRRTAIPDVDVPGNMLHVRQVGALGRNEVPASESSWIAVLTKKSHTASTYQQTMDKILFRSILRESYDLVK